MIEAGIELDMTQLRQTGTRALAIAFIGSVLPIIAGIGISILMVTDESFGFKAAIAVGFSFAPTSLGVASSALSAGGVSDTPVGQLIMAACVLSDIIGLVLLSMFQVLVKEDAKLIEYFIPIISSFGFLIVLGLAAVLFLSGFIDNTFLPMFPKKHRNVAMFILLFAMCLGYLPMMYYTKASYLAGAFLVGFTFSLINGAHAKFKQSTHSIMEWLLRVFFAASIGFQVPFKLFQDKYVIGMGFAFWGSCVLLKFVVAFFVPRFEVTDGGAIYDPYKRDFMVTGLSMTCRGELNFIIAAFALNEGVIDPTIYAAVVFAVLLSAITSPFLLLKSIVYFKALQKKHLEATLTSDDGKMPVHFHIHLETKGAWSLLETLHAEMHSLNLVVEDYRTGHSRGLDPTIVNDIYVRDTDTRVSIPNVGSQREWGTEDVKEEAIIVAREKEILMALYRKLKDLGIIELDVDQWTPWDWNLALDSISLKRPNGEESTLDFFMNLFDFTDSDGSGVIDESELYVVLDSAGISVTKEGLAAMIAVVDLDGDGEISRDEWNHSIAHYLEQKKVPQRITQSMRDVIGVTGDTDPAEEVSKWFR